MIRVRADFCVLTDGRRENEQEQAGEKRFTVMEYTYIFRFFREQEEGSQSVSRWILLDIIFTEHVDVDAAIKAFRKAAAELRILTVAVGSE